MPTPEFAQLTYRARQAHAAEMDRRRSRHLDLAMELARGGDEARRLVDRARAVVALWRREGTCSEEYIRRWSELLALPPEQLAQRMNALGEWEGALFQNSPWAWRWT